MAAHCSKCGQDKDVDQFYKGSKGRAYNAWCKTCYREWHRARYVPKNGANDSPRNCVWCGESFVPKQRRPAVYCSRKCKDDAKNADEAAKRLASKSPRLCQHCSDVIGPERRSDAKFCSAECNAKAHALKRKLRARGGHAGDPGYLRAEICERDGWRCGICGKPVDPKSVHPDPGFGSLDHVIPVSHGGSSDPSNLRLTHLRCNLARRNRFTAEQVAMF